MKSCKNTTFYRIVSVATLSMMLLLFVSGCINTNFSLDNTGDYSAEYSGEIDFLEIDFSAGSLYIKESDTFSIEASNISTGTFESSLSGTTLTISDKSGGSRFWENLSFNIGLIGSKSPEVIIYIPENYFFEDANITVGAGRVNIDSLKAESVSLKSGAGSINISELTADRLKVESGVGKVEISGTVSESAEIDCGVGEITLNLEGNKEDYNFNITVGVGSAEINETVFSGVTDKEITHPDADGFFDIKVGVGKVSVLIS